MKIIVIDTAGEVHVLEATLFQHLGYEWALHPSLTDPDINSVTLHGTGLGALHAKDVDDAKRLLSATYERIGANRFNQVVRERIRV